jgi:hypothetical protein
MTGAPETVTGWSDWEIKHSLELRDAGQSAAEVAAALGRSRSAVCGLWKRVADELAAAERAGLLAALLALGMVAPGLADTVRIMGSTVTLRATDRAGALAEVEFFNDPSNGPGDDAVYLLDLDGLAVDARFTWNAAGDSDRLDLTPPEGVICLPDCSLVLDEGDTGTVWLYDLNRVGM